MTRDSKQLVSLTEVNDENDSICLPRGLQIEFFICIAKLHIGMFIILLCDKKIGGELLMASKAAIAAKEQSVKELAERIKASKLVLLVEFIGTNVADDTVLRSWCFKNS